MYHKLFALRKVLQIAVTLSSAIILRGYTGAAEKRAIIK